MSDSTFLRAARMDTDVPGIARICTLCEPGHPVSEEHARTWLRPQPPRGMHLPLVSVDADDAVTGYACVIHAAEAPAQHFYVWVGVDPTRRRQGIGTALWQACLGRLRGLGARRVTSNLLDSDPVGLAFAERRGFRIDRQVFHSSLDLEPFDEKPFLPIIAGLERQGIRFGSLADYPASDESLRKFYDLNLAVLLDVPGEEWELSNYAQFFEDHILKAPWFRREGHLLAVDGEAWVGMALVSLNPKAQSAYNVTTGVVRAYRRRKIALALKVLAVRYARRHGARHIGTDNDSLNAPMLVVNQRLGYRAETGQYMLAMDLGLQ